MIISKKAAKWLNELTQELTALNASYPAAKELRERLGAKWYNARRDGYTKEQEDQLWRELREAEKSMRSMEDRIQYLTMVTGVLEGKPLYANEVMYSDVNPYEVVEMKTDKTWVVRAMTATIKEDAKKELQDSFIPGGFCGHFDNDKQEWDITPDEKGAIRTIRFHSSKTSRGWFDKSQRFSISTNPVKFYDYNF